MRRVRIALAGCLMLALAAAVVADDPPSPKPIKDKIVGVWKVKKLAPGFPCAETCEFAADGKIVFSSHLPVVFEFKGGKMKGVFKLTSCGKYEVDNNTLRIIFKSGDGKDIVHAATITKLTEKELHTKNQKGAVNQFERK